MTTKERFLDVIARIHILARQSINESAERWLNIALRYDYIPFPFKERADELLRMQNEIVRFNVSHIITAENLNDAIAVLEFIANTRFPDIILKSVAAEFENEIEWQTVAY